MEVVKDVIMFYKDGNFIMNSGVSIPKQLVKGVARIGTSIESHIEEGFMWKVCENNTDGDCVGGVCPIR